MADEQQPEQETRTSKKAVVATSISMILAILAASVATYMWLEAQAADHERWVVESQQWSESGGRAYVQETLVHPGPKPLIVKVTFATLALLSAIAVAGIALASVVVLRSRLRTSAVIIAVMGSLITFLAIMFTLVSSTRRLLGAEISHWTSIIAGPFALWGSVNFMASILWIVRIFVHIRSRVLMVYHILLPSAGLAKVAKLLGMSQQVAPSMTTYALLGDADFSPPASFTEWASRLQAHMETLFNLEEYEELAQRLKSPNLPPLLARGPVATVKELAEGLSMLGQPPDAAEFEQLTAVELVISMFEYFRCLSEAAAAHTYKEIWVARASKAMKRNGIRDPMQWRMVADQYRWYQGQALSVTDVAAKLLAKRPSSAAALGVWLCVDATMSWCKVLPALWVAPATRAEELQDRRAVIHTLVSSA